MRLRFVPCGVVVLCLLVGLSGGCSPRDKVELISNSLTASGIAAYYEGDMENAERLLRGATAHSHDDSLARYYLAKAYLARGTPEGRIAAEETFGDLVALASSEPLYLEALARLQLRQGFRSNARRALDRLVDLRPHDTGALYELGRLAETDWWRYVHPPDRERSVALYRRTLEADSLHAPSLVRLAVLAIEADSLETAAPLVERLMRAYPDREDARLLLGVLHERRGNLEAAEEVFASVVSGMPLMRRHAYAWPSFLEPDTTVGFWEYGDDEPDSVSLYDETFWARHDPTPATPANERFVVHASRMAMADFLYGDSARGVRGWETAPGEFYVRFGKPVRRRFEIMTWIHTFDIRGQDVDITFHDYAHNGTFMLPIGVGLPSKEIMVMRAGFESTSLEEDKITPVSLPYAAAWFRTEDGEPRLELAIATTNDRWSCEISARDSAWDETYHGAEVLEPYPLPAGVGTVRRAVLGMTLYPGGDAAHVQVALGHEGAVEAELPPALPTDGFALSDLVLGFETATGFVPNPGFAYPRGAVLGLRFELYGVRRDATGVGYARIKLAIIPEAKRRAGGRVASALFGDRDRTPPFVTSELNEEVASDVWERTLRIDLSELPAGRYRVGLVVQDLLTGDEAERELPFELGAATP